jgi:UDP-N-acetylglucosamine--N-acetylmuramyl-(pentapeptide) pyrophosphoryl-undecaprenol N-acetylglucosamine transferase
MSKKVIIAGGGTGGHIFPAIAIGQALQRLDKDIELLFVGAKGKMEMEKIPQAGFPIIGLDIAGFNRSALWKNILLPIKLVRSLFQAGSVLKKFKPDVVVGVGGFASFPMLKEAQRKGIPTLIQEQNSYAGKSNQLLGKEARVICVAYEGMDQFFPADKIIQTGNPVRPQISASTLSREDGVRYFELDPGRKTVLVFGGSLGARSINDAIAAGIPQLLDHSLQLVWQTGKGNASEARQEWNGKKGVWAQEFITKMEMAYAAADVVVARAGAMTIGELCVAGKPVIFVPYPHAAEDHQTVNAMSLVKKDAGLLVADAAASAELVPRLLSLCDDAGLQQQLSKNISALAIKDADERIARQIIKLINK